jgi:hypothetical protein
MVDCAKKQQDRENKKYIPFFLASHCHFKTIIYNLNILKSDNLLELQLFFYLFELIDFLTKSFV